MSTFGGRIRDARTAKKLSQQQLADLIGVKSSGVISNWEKDLNKPDADKIVRLCASLGISASYLLDYYGESPFSRDPDFDRKELDHIKKYRSLNESGQLKAEDYIDTLLQVPAYRRDAEQPGVPYKNNLIAARGGGVIEISPEEADRLDAATRIALEHRRKHPKE